MDHMVYDNLYAPHIVDYYDDDEPNVPPLMKRNEADAPYIRPLSDDYGDQIFHTSHDDDDPYFTPRTHHEDFEDLYVPPLMKHNDAGDPYIPRPLVDYRDKKFHIFDDQKYAEQLQLEEALVLSSASHASTSSSSKRPPIDSSKLPERYCGICMDTKTESEMFRNTNVCGHMYCFDCIREYIAVKIKENIADVRCPDPSCKGLIRPEVCRFIVPREHLENVGDELLIKDRSTSDVAAGSSSSSDDLSHDVDDFNFEAFLNKDEKFPISHKKYIEEMELQEALLISASESHIPSQTEYATSSSTDLPFFPYSSADYAMSSSTNLPFMPYVTYESTQVPDKFCGICMDTKTEFEMFINDDVCGHTFCIDCIREHIGAKINENIANVRCPDPNCKGLIGPNVCRYILPKEVLERWESALCESLIIGSQKFYCPFKDCSALLVDDSAVAVKDTKCPHCNRKFCAQCKVPWHSEMDCKEFQMLNDNGEIDQSDKKVLELAKKNKWQRCPKCNYYVGRTSGCNDMSCRCGHRFCYGCGNKRSECSCGRPSSRYY
ncbi:Zinc finger, C6HC-type [Artemisia annua]|uniref:RBR-type E3 ubiquitin transferase n=1 Tax=Artemisia annua TaxID=35608 RepID=A0A2U1P4A1_ARTAN|nr:Zinc finger, C6HC-type [Artemisia annua]